ncbi:MAG: sigma factor-like helix-turn-helix DNA-binding protein [Pseudomonadota bacterium]
MTYQEIADVLGISRQRVQQIEREALEKLARRVNKPASVGGLIHARPRKSMMEKRGLAKQFSVMLRNSPWEISPYRGQYGKHKRAEKQWRTSHNH